MMHNPRRNPFNRILERLAPKRFTRRHDRYAADLPCQLEFVMRAFSMESVLKDLSQGGCMVRPGLFYLMERTGEEVFVVVEGQRLPGKIVSTRPIGYSVQFDEELTEETIKAVVGQDAQPILPKGEGQAKAA
jgi:hypothetical protein